MQSLIQQIEANMKKPKVVSVRSGDTVRVHQKIKEGSKERVQIFEGLVIRTKRHNSVLNAITVRRIASGIGVEKTFLLHSPLVEKVDVMKRSSVNRNYLTYMRNRSGKSARLEAVDFDRNSVNDVTVDEAPVEVAEKVEEPTVDEAKTTDAAEDAPETTDKE